MNTPHQQATPAMRLLVLTGFFGSGKTTFLLRALRLAIREAGLRTILVQNEIGRVGVDPEVFRSEDLALKELLGGCICCNLSTRLVSVLNTLVADKSADLVCIEASGIATPSMVRQILCGTGLEALPLLQVNLLDAARLQKIEKLIAMPVVRQGIEAADLCIVNKIADAPEGFMESFEALVREIRPGARLHYTNLTESATLPGPVAAALRTFFLDAGPPPGREGPPHSHRHTHHGHPSVGSAEVVFPSPNRISREKLCAEFDGLARAIEQMGGLIAHVKVAIITADGTSHFLNSTGSGHAPRAPLADQLDVCRVVVNAIAWSIAQARLETLTTRFTDSISEG